MTIEGILHSGARLADRYEVVSELGIGSFGRVYAARQLSTGQAVAIKTIRIVDRDTEADVRRHTDRFRREMRLCAALSHPHIVRLLDSGELPDGALFAVFELVPGMTLREVLASDGKLEAVEAIRLMTQVLDALSCAHAQGVVHRDLKPENIMVTKTGMRRNAMVLDFGLAGFAADYAGTASRLTATHEAMGTPCYAAPEQLRGEQPSPRADLYSWGLIFLECLTGEIAVPGSTGHEVIMRQLSAEPVPIPAPLRGQRLGRLLEIVTAKDPEERAVTIAGLVDSLAAIEREAARARPVGVLDVAREGELRQVTLVACRTVVESANGTPVELEDLDEVLHAQLDLYARTADPRGGKMVRIAPDRALLVFGYPRAQEHDARRAVETALGIVAETQRTSDPLERERGLRVDVRIGIHSGLVIVREGAGGYEIVGSAADIAVRIRDRAGPAEVLVSEETRRLLRGEVEWEDSVALEPMESGRPTALHRVRGIAVTPGGSGGSTVVEPPLIERADELAQLRGLWQRAEAGGARACLVMGDPGMGKSRLLRELRRMVPREAWLECRCVPDNSGSPLRPIMDLLTSFPEPLERLIERYGLDRAEAFPLLARLLGLSEHGPAAATPLSPDKQKERTLATVVSLLLGMAREQTRVFVVEDLHWADPTTIDLLTILLEDLRAAHADPSGATPRICVLLSARPDFATPWNPADVTTISLSHLTRIGVEAMVRARVPAREAVPTELVDHIASRTDGVPLFVEEVTHLLLDTGALSDRPRGRGRTRWERAIPGTLRELLAARLDSLSPSARETVQVTAAIGRDVRHEMLAAVAGKDETILRHDIRELVNARLLHQRRSVPDRVENSGRRPHRGHRPPAQRPGASYIFRHALLRDAAYESLLRGSRERVHRRIASTMRERFAEVAEQQPEVLAHHLEAGGEDADAAAYRQLAGDRALQRAAYAEARQHLERGLAAAARLPESPARTRAEIELLTSLGTVLLSTQGFAAPEVEETFARARSLCDRIGGDVPPKILSGIIGVTITRGNREATDQLLPHLTRMADSPRDVVEEVTGCTGLGIDAFWRGAHEAARRYLDRARPAYLSDAFQRYVREYGYDGGIFSYAYTAWNLWVLGRPAEAEVTCRELLALSEGSLDPHARSLALSFAVVVAHARRDAEETIARSERLISIATEQKLYFWLALGLCGHGAGLALRGEHEQGIAEARQGLELTRMIGAMLSYGYYVTLLAGALYAAGRFDEARTVTQEGLALCRDSLGCFHEPELLRLEGELLREGRSSEAEATLRRAVDMARRNGARAWELRAATSLGRLLAGRGAVDEARTILRTALEDVGEGHDAEEARALLATLG